MVQNGVQKYDEILTPQWWNYVRFSWLGDALNQVFASKPELKEAIREDFRNHKDKLSYFSFFNWIEGAFGIQLKAWQCDAIESRLDRMCLAYIDYWEFVEFCETYEIYYDEPDRPLNDTEAIMDARLNISYRDYKLTKADYFQGNKTILLSEKAALAKCAQIWDFFHEKTNFVSEINQGKIQKFVDKDFGPLRKSDLDRCKFAMYKTGEIPRKGYADPREVDWVFVDELCELAGNQSKPQFVDDGASSNDCKQGNLGDCWLISAMSVLATRDELLVGGRSGMDYDKDMIVDKIIADCLSKGVYPPIFHRFRGIGLFVIRLFVEFQWIYVIVDERIPVDSKTKKPIFGSCRNVHEMWVALIEKAFAKVYGCYENLISGYVDEGINALTAMPSEKIFIKNETTGVFPHKTVEQNYGGSEGLWQLLKDRDNEGCLMGCSIKGDTGGPLVLNGKDSGLLKNHAYSLNDILEINDPFNEGQTVRLLRLRNPWGKSEWKGAWSGESKEMQKYRPVIQEYINELPPDEQFDIDADDGIFFIHYDDWKDNFTALFVNIDFPENWTGLRFRSKWTKSNAGGLPKKNDPAHFERFAKNPQFLIKPEQDM